MNNTQTASNSWSVRRIVAVLDPVGPYEPTLALASSLARRVGAHGLGLLLRDDRLFGAADPPFAREVQRLPAALAARTPHDANRQYRARVRQIERALLGTERDTPGRWTVAEAGMTQEAVRRVIQTGDVIVVAGEERTAPYHQLGQDLLAEATHPVLTVPSPAREIQSVQVVYEPDDQRSSVLALAGELARRLGEGLLDVIAVGGDVDSETLAIHIQQSISNETPLSVRVLRQPRLDVAAAARLLGVKNGILVVPTTTYRRNRGRFAHPLRLLSWPFLLVNG
jgi:hypothetical protein